MIMKRFIFILIALIATLTISAQSVRLGNASFSNTYVVQQHVDVGVVFQTTYHNIYLELPAQSRTYIVVSNPTFTIPIVSYCYTSYTEQYRRGVGLYNYNVINRNNYIRTTGLVDVDSQNNYKNFQKYYCYNYK